MNFDVHKKEQEGWLYENCEGKKIAVHSKLKLWTFFDVMVNMNDFTSLHTFINFLYYILTLKNLRRQFVSIIIISIML